MHSLKTGYSSISCFPICGHCAPCPLKTKPIFTSDAICFPVTTSRAAATPSVFDTTATPRWKNVERREFRVYARSDMSYSPRASADVCAEMFNFSECSQFAENGKTCSGGHGLRADSWCEVDGLDSRMTWAFAPPNPKELMLARLMSLEKVVGGKWVFLVTTSTPKPRKSTAR